jgi:hypothetical protein
VKRKRSAASLVLLATLLAGPVGASSAESALTFLVPNGGDSLESGITYTLQWEASPGVLSFVAAYSLDQGSTWITIGEAAAGPSLDWTIPAVDGDGVGCLVKVTGFDVAGDRVNEGLSEVFLAAAVN